MSFTIKCNQCNIEHDIKEINPKILIDVANENFDDPDYNYILITCNNCSNEIEL